MPQYSREEEPKQNKKKRLPIDVSTLSVPKAIQPKDAGNINILYSMKSIQENALININILVFGMKNFILAFSYIHF